MSNQDKDQLFSKLGDGLKGDEILGVILNFAGLITKIRHNQLHDVIPLTMKALKKTGQEITFFTEYAPIFSDLRRTKQLSLDERIHYFKENILEFFGLMSLKGAVVGEILAHESRVRELQNQLAEMARFEQSFLNTRFTVTSSAILSSKPHCAGALVVSVASWKPSELEAFAMDPAANFEVLLPTKRKMHLAYAKVADRNASILEIDPITALLLGFVNKDISIDQIAGELSKQIDMTIEPNQVLSLFLAIPDDLPLQFC